MTQPVFKPGIYRHYKGDYYLALHLVKHHETEEIFVVYSSADDSAEWIREWNSPGKDQLVR